MPNTKNIIAANLRAERARKGWSRRELAEETGISEATLATYECGESRITLETAWVLADTYGLSLDALCGRDKTKEAL